MNLLLDLVGSVIIAGIMLLMMLNANIYQSNARFASDSELQLQQNAKTLSDILGYDLRKIGYEYDGNPFIFADSEKVSFYADMDRDGTPDIVTCTSSDPYAAKSTKNPNDRILLRQVGEEVSAGPSLGLTKLKFSFFDEFGIETFDLEKINYVKAEFWVESIEPVNDEYLFTYWELTISPRNL